MTQTGSKTGQTNPLWYLIAEVGNGKCTLQSATTRLREYIKTMTPEEFETWRTGAGDVGRQIMRIAEAFNQEVTVIAAGQ